MDCPLCVVRPDQIVLWQDAQCRVIDVGDADYPGFCRAIWREHIREMSDLPIKERAHLLAVVHAVEVALREVLQPCKINVASLGNQVPHLHWHIIPRFVDDPHFPDPIWAVRKRNGVQRAFPHDAFKRAFAQALNR